MLRTLAAALIGEAVMLVILFVARLPGKALLEWYRQLGASALAMDVLSAYVCVRAARMATSTPPLVPLAVLAIQVTHDLAFGALKRLVPRGSMRVIDLFKDYARPAILWYDALIVLSVLSADVLLQILVPSSLLRLIAGVAAYVSLVFLHSF